MSTDERVSHAPPRWLWPALIAPFVLPYLFNAVVDRVLEHDGPQFSDLIFADVTNVNRSLAADVWSGPLERGAHAKGTVAVEDVDTFEATVAAAAESVGSRALCVMLDGKEAGAFVADALAWDPYETRTLVCNTFWHGRVSGFVVAQQAREQLLVETVYGPDNSPGMKLAGITADDL